MMKHWKG